MSNFVDCERDQAFLLPPDLRDWIPEDDLAHFVIEAVSCGSLADIAEFVTVDRCGPVSGHRHSQHQLMSP